ncbi:MAG: myo-inositol catabolism protein IolH [Pirellulaceae bacterium]|nr:MAG: myo-inositol catabolism protein IolH [Pirellulaceae bacterium]
MNLSANRRQTRPSLAAFPKCYLDQISHQRTMSVFDWIEQARSLDADGLEMYEGFFTSLDDGYLDDVRAAIAEAGFAMPMLCCSPDFTSPHAADRQAAIDYQQQMIRVAHRLGGEGVVCRVLSGQRWPQVSRQQGLAYAREGILACLPLAEELGVILGIENHYKDGHWRFPEFAQKQDVFLELVQSIPASPHFGVQYDPSNALVAGDDPLELLQAVVDRVVSMHASDRHLIPGATLEDLTRIDAAPEGAVGYADILRHGVTGKGLNDYDRIFSLLSHAGYTGWISIEDGMNGMEEMAESLAFLRRKIAEHWPDTTKRSELATD